MAEQKMSLVELFRLLTPVIFSPVLDELQKLWKKVRTCRDHFIIVEIGLRLRLMDSAGREVHRKSVKYQGKIQ